MLQDEHGIPLVVLTGSEPFEGLFKGSVHQVGINLGGRDIPVSERPFDHENIGGGRIQVGGEGVAQAVRADSLIDTRLAKPVFYAVGEKQRWTFPVTLGAAIPAIPTTRPRSSCSRSWNWATAGC